MLAAIVYEALKDGLVSVKLTDLQMLEESATQFNQCLKITLEANEKLTLKRDKILAVNTELNNEIGRLKSENEELKQQNKFFVHDVGCCVRCLRPFETQKIPEYCEVSGAKLSPKPEWHPVKCLSYGGSGEIFIGSQDIRITCVMCNGTGSVDQLKFPMNEAQEQKK